jgi:hypothetical protein
MLVQRSRKYFARSIALEREIASWVAFGFRPHRASSPRGLNDLDDLRDRLEKAKRRVAESERLVVGWREVTEGEQAAGHDVADLLKTFENGVEVAMSDREEAEKNLARRLVDIFEGARGRLPKNDQELHEWLASPEGKAATVFEPAPASRWGETGRS